MSTHLQPELTERTQWLQIAGDGGIAYIPMDVISLADLADVPLGEYVTLPECIRQYCPESADSTQGTLTIVTGYGLRLSAPGYLDCTDWDVYTSLREARAAQRRMTDIGEEP